MCKNTANFKSIRMLLTHLSAIQRFFHAGHKLTTMRPIGLRHHCHVLCKLSLSGFQNDSWHGTTISKIVCSVNIGTNDEVTYNNKLPLFLRDKLSKKGLLETQCFSIDTSSLCFYSPFSVFLSLCVLVSSLCFCLLQMEPEGYNLVQSMVPDKKLTKQKQNHC